MITANDKKPFKIKVVKKISENDIEKIIKFAFYRYAPDRQPTDKQIEYLIDDYLNQ